MEPPRAAVPSVAQARQRLERHGPALLVGALDLLGAPPTPRAQAEGLWTAAGLAWAMAEALRSAQQTSGRAVVETIFALHDQLGQRSAQPTPEAIRRVREALAPYHPWIGQDLAAHGPWRTVWLRWVDILSERLTMHRYGDPQRRRLHAQALLADPLRLITPEDQTPSDPALTDYAERLLAFWDLVHAEAHAVQGWNRITLPGTDQLGGFFGLADEALPPSPESIGQAAQALLEVLKNQHPMPLGPALEAGAAALHEAMLAALRQRLESGRWPEWSRKPKHASIWQRIWKRA